MFPRCGSVDPAASGVRPARSRYTAVMTQREARFRIGDIVRHRVFPFRGVIYDVDPVFDSTDEWYEAIPEAVRPHKDQPFYHLYAENEESVYEAYVSEQNLLPDDADEPLRHPMIDVQFERDAAGDYRPRHLEAH